MAKKKVKASKIELKKLPNVWELIKKTWFEGTTFWRPLTGLLIIYALLYFVLVMGLSFSSYLQNPLSTSTGGLSKTLSTIFAVINTNSLTDGTQSDATVLIQFLLFLIASLAFIWTLRKLQALKKIKLRDAYYQGTSTLIPVILVSMVLILTVLPAIAGSAILATALQSGASGIETLIVSLISGLLLLLSLVLFVMLWPAFYIVSLPQTRPMQAIRAAAKVTKKHRFAILRKMIMLAILSFVLLFIILLPIALAVSVIVPEVAFVLLFIVFGFCHVYLYTLYRSLL